MADLKDRVEKGLSEVRTTVLGAQILLGFQYQALFQARFDQLPRVSRAIEAASFLLLFLTVVLLLAPAAFHRLSERGDATRAQCHYTALMASAALLPFTAALGLNIEMVVSEAFGRAFAGGVALAAVTLALFLWFGLEMIRRRPASEPSMTRQKIPLKDRISQLLTESRIVLPGVQALLGFQFAAYLTDRFQQLSPTAKSAHTAGLLLLLVAMILLMTPAPYHRLAERGEDTARLDRVGVGFVLAALAPLALGLACDAYVVLEVVTGRAALAAATAGAAALGALSVWFGWPLISRRRRDAPVGRRLPAE